VLGWLGIEIAITAALLGFYDYVAAVSWVVYVFAALHGFEIILRAMAVDLRDEISTVRTLTLAAINYVQLMLWFGLVYALNYQNLIDQSHTLSAALWFQRPVPAEPITDRWSTKKPKTRSTRTNATSTRSRSGAGRSAGQRNAVRRK
jgi:hypothetical protein